MVEHRLLFAEDKDGDQGDFAEEMRDQHVEERLKYAKDIENAMRECISNDNREETITISEAREAILAADQYKTEKELDTYIARGFGSPVNKLQPDESVKISIFIKRLQAGLLKRSVAKGIDKLKSALKKNDAANMFMKVVAMTQKEKGSKKGK